MYTERNAEGERGRETNGTLGNSASDLGSSDWQNDLVFLPRIMFPAHIQPSRCYNQTFRTRIRLRLCYCASVVITNCEFALKKLQFQPQQSGLLTVQINSMALTFLFHNHGICQIQKYFRSEFNLSKIWLILLLFILALASKLILFLLGRVIWIKRNNIQC